MNDYTETERRILDMWPKYEDGEYVWIGDDVSGMDVRSFVFTESGVMVTNLTSVPAYGECRKYGEPLKRPALKVLDADGVEIKVGDTVYGVWRSQHSFDVIDPHHIDPKVGEAFSVRCYDRDEGEECHCRPELLTHDLPDSWERLEEDARQLDIDLGDTTDDYPRMSCCRDLIRRAKALAEKEAGR